MRRINSGKRIVLGERDFAIFNLLYRHPLLNSQDLIAHVAPKSTKRFIERLGHLYHDGGFLNRPAQQWDRARALYAPIFYSLSDKGLGALLEQSTLPHRAVLTHAQKPGYRIPQFQHLLMICRAVAQAELATSSAADQRFVPVEEILAKSKSRNANHGTCLSIPVTIPRSRHNPGPQHQSHIVPDALYGIEYDEAGKKRYRFFALEAEHTSPLRRRSLKLTSTLKKLLAYQAALYSGSYKSAIGVPNLFPHFVARDDNHLAQIQDLANDLLEPKELKLFRFSINS